MISWLKGRVHDLSGDVVTLDVQGVGYEVFCSRRSVETLGIGEEAAIIVHTDVKEDSIRLYGFEDKLEKQVFLLLLKVKGVGTRSASDIVSQIDKIDLLRIIGSGDLTKLQGIKGVGKKTAERIVLELKDHVAEFAVERQGGGLVVEKARDEPYQDAIDALQALGFSRGQAERAVGQVEQGRFRESGEVVRQALRFV